MQCPKCHGVMAPKTYHGERLHRCDRCGGIFITPEVLTHMKSTWMSEALDTGDPREGKAYDDMGQIVCPACDAPMSDESDAEQSHIWFEQCSRCHGIYLDAGEFSDLKYNTLLDRVRDLVRKPRGGG